MLEQKNHRHFLGSFCCDFEYLDEWVKFPL